MDWRGQTGEAGAAKSAWPQGDCNTHHLYWECEIQAWRRENGVGGRGKHSWHLYWGATAEQVPKERLGHEQDGKSRLHQLIPFPSEQEGASETLAGQG